jgi:mycoredoxin-dependent peroxiredoxin
MAIEVGQEAPDFTLKNPAGDDVTLSSFRGQKNVVLAFYPLAFSPVCTDQLTQMGGNGSKYADSDAQVIAVSVDSRYAQAAFAQSIGAADSVTFLADFEPKGATSQAYGVYLDAAGISGRATFVIDKAGVVQGVSLTAVPTDMPDEDAYFATLATCSV